MFCECCESLKPNKSLLKKPHIQILWPITVWIAEQELNYCCILAVSELPTTPSNACPPLLLAGSNLHFRKDDPGPVASSWVISWCSWSLNITTCGIKTGMLSFTCCTFGPRATAQLWKPLSPSHSQLGLHPTLWGLHSISVGCFW